ncbi:MAG TPA: glycosyltransferase [Solirubrobacterales bacterium]|nr:glycosyltransferase [Solirubrobacterales bacterium]
MIDNYNYGAFLPQAIASARAQTHAAVNVIVVDDGSTDGSREVLAGIDDEVTVVLKDNGGQGSALNAGAECCHGDIVMFLDADDLLKPEAAARIAATFAADPGLAKVQYRMDVVDAAGRPTGEEKPWRHVPMPNGDLRQAELDYSFDLGWMPTSANAFRIDALRRVLPIPDDYRILADWYLVHMTTLLGRVRSLEEICASYRVHGGNNFEHERPELDLDHLRRSIRLARPTCAGLERLGDELGLPRPRRVTSVADLGHRLVSLKLDPGRHPVRNDSVRSLLAEAMPTIRRRDDVSTTMKAMFAGWFVAIAMAPRRLARPLAVYFLFPERRGGINRVLKRLHRNGRAAPR